MIQTSGIPLKEIIRELKNANYSYKKLYKNYANTIGSTITAEEQSFSMILDRYSNSSRLLKYYEPFISPHINVFLLKISTNFADAITLIDKIDNYFNNINNDSTAYVEINNLSDFSIGMVKEGNITPKSKYKNSFQLSSLLPVKSLKRTYIQSKINEERAVKNLILAGRTIDPEIKQIRLFMHNRNIEHQKYLCDSYFIL